MTLSKRLLIASAAILCLTTSTAQAHRVWLKPSTTQVEGKAVYITFDFASGDDVFDNISPGAKLDGLTIIAPDGSSLAAENPFISALRSTFDLKLTQTGTYRVSVVTDTVSGRYTQGGETKRFRGAAADLATLIPADATDIQTGHMVSRVETFVSSGKPTATVMTPAGKGLEIIPVTSPEDFVTGETAKFRAYMDGAPLSGLNISVVPADVRHRGALKDISATTDDKGEFTVTWPLAQMYWIGASYPARQMPNPAASQAASQTPPQTTPQGSGPNAAPSRGSFDRPPENRWSYSGTFDVAPF